MLFLIFIIEKVIKEFLHEFDSLACAVFCFFTRNIDWRLVHSLDGQFIEFKWFFVENQMLGQFHELTFDVILYFSLFNEVGEYIEKLLDVDELVNGLVVPVVAECTDQLDAGLQVLEVGTLHDLAAALDDQLALAAYRDVVHPDEELLERVFRLDEQVNDFVLLAFHGFTFAHAQRRE